MERKILICFGFVLLIIAAVAGKNMFFVDYNLAKPVSQISSNSQQNVATNSGSFDTVNEILATKSNLACDLTDDSGRQITAFIKNGTLRANIKGKTIIDTGSILLKDKKIYFWNNVFSAMVNEPSEISSQNSIAQMEQEVIGIIEKYKQYCKPQAVNDSVFTLPAGKKFTDYSSMLK